MFLWQTIFCVCILILNGFGSVLLPSPAPAPVRSDNLALLTGTLRTYQKASCDGEYMALRCPSGTTISVQLAQYGKNAPALTLCSSNTNAHPELMDIVDGYANVTCHWPTAIQTVVGLCQKKTSCKFQTSPGTFGGDPCPGSRKYVEVAYKCRPSEFRSVIGCDSEVIQLKCNRSSRLAIYSANYGRTEYESVSCPQPKGVSEESCLSSFATETVMQMCHGKRRCALGVNPATFGTPCKPESKMYLKVINTCVPRKVLKEKYQGELEPDEMFEDETEYESGDPVGGVLEQPSIYSPDHSKGWVNPKSTAKPHFPSNSRSSLEYRPSATYTNQRSTLYRGEVRGRGSIKVIQQQGSIPHSSNTLSRNINQSRKIEQGQSVSQSDFEFGKKNLSPTLASLPSSSSSSSHKVFPKTRHNFRGEYDQDFNGTWNGGVKTRSNYNSNNNTASVASSGGVMSSSSQSNSLGTNHSQDDLRLIYLISQGIRAYDFVSRNKESLWLYITISIASALLVVILVILVKIWVQRSTGLRARRATANLTATSSKPSSSSAGPITSTALSDIDELSVVTDEVTELPSILHRGSPGDELDLQTSSTTHLISNSSNNTSTSIPINTSGGGLGVGGSCGGVSGSPSMLTGVVGGFNSSVVGVDGTTAVMPGGGEGALLLGGGVGGGCGMGSVMGAGGSVMNSSTFMTSGSSTLGRKSRHHHHQHHHHHLQQQQPQQQQQQQEQQYQQQQNNHPSSTFMTMTTYGMPMASSAVGPHYSQLQQQGTNPSSSHAPVSNPSTMTLGRAMGGGGGVSNVGRNRDPNIHFYYD